MHFCVHWDFIILLLPACLTFNNYVRPLMLLMGSKPDEQIPQVHWGNFLTMVIYCIIYFCPLCTIRVKYWWLIFWEFSTCIAGCDALACAVCVFIYLISLQPDFFLFISVCNFFCLWFCLAWSIGFWEHCNVWAEHFLVLGDFSCSILLSNLGAVSCSTEFNLYLVYTFSSLWIKSNNMLKDVFLDSQVNNVSVLIKKL